MIWTEQHNDMLFREMYLLEPWKYKKESPQRGNVWEQISASFNELDDAKFDVTQKSIGDHYKIARTTEHFYKMQNNGNS